MDLQAGAIEAVAQHTDNSQREAQSSRQARIKCEGSHWLDDPKARPPFQLRSCSVHFPCEQHTLSSATPTHTQQKTSCATSPTPSLHPSTDPVRVNQEMKMYLRQSSTVQQNVS